MLTSNIKKAARELLVYPSIPFNNSHKHKWVYIYGNSLQITQVVIGYKTQILSLTMSYQYPCSF